MTNYAFRLPAALLLLTLPLAANAQEIAEPAVEPDRTLEDAGRVQTVSLSGAGVDAYARESIVGTKGSTQLGAGFAFQTSRAGLEGSPVYFTDVAMLRPYLRISVHDDVEIAAEADILAKQTQGENSVVQSGSMSMIYGIASHYALYASGSSGKLYNRRGNLLSGSAGLMARKKIEDFLLFEGDFSGGVTELSSESLGHRAKVDIADVSVGGKIVGMTPGNFKYGAGGWIGARFSFPVSQRGDLDTMSMSSSASMDVKPSLDVTLGGVVRMREWDLWMSYSILDRGDASAPETTLPILNGGFDQNQTTIGVTRRFGHATDKNYARGL
jgi:hypothetical protein